MNFKKLAVAAAVSSATFSGAAMAELSGNVEVLSQYLFRGVPQTGGAAVSGGLDYEDASGFYTGVWASNIDSGFAGSVETNVYAGFATDLFDVGVLYYYYPEEKEDPDSAKSNGGKTANTVEFYGSVTFDIVTVGAYYTPSNYFATDESAYGFTAALSAPVSELLSFDASVGYNAGKGNEAVADDVLDGFGKAAKGDGYLDYSIGFSAALENGVGMSFALVGTDISGDDPRIIVGASYGFGL